MTFYQRIYEFKRIKCSDPDAMPHTSSVMLSGAPTSIEECRDRSGLKRSCAFFAFEDAAGTSASSRKFQTELIIGSDPYQAANCRAEHSLNT
jgi:hypothetical protein